MKMKKYEGILSYTLFNGISDECKVSGNGKIEFYKNLLKTTYTLKMDVNKCRDLEVTYNGDLQPQVIELLYSKDKDAFIKNAFAVQHSIYKSSWTGFK